MNVTRAPSRTRMCVNPVVVGDGLANGEEAPDDDNSDDNAHPDADADGDNNHPGWATREGNGGRNWLDRTVGGGVGVGGGRGEARRGGRRGRRRPRPKPSSNVMRETCQGLRSTVNKYTFSSLSLCCVQHGKRSAWG